jgi:hypothetical protein
MNREEAQDLIEKLQLWLNGEQVEFYSKMELQSIDIAFMQAPKLTVKPKPMIIWLDEDEAKAYSRRIPNYNGFVPYRELTQEERAEAGI